MDCAWIEEISVWVSFIFISFTKRSKTHAVSRPFYVIIGSNFVNFFSDRVSGIVHIPMSSLDHLACNYLRNFVMIVLNK